MTSLCCPTKKFDIDEIDENVIISSDCFDVPAVALNRSGGTASFFELKVKEDKSRWLGKHLSRTFGELMFYIEAEKAKRTEDAVILPFLPFLIPFKGVLRTECLMPGGERVLNDLLVLENLRSGKTRLRFVDIKMGPRTSSVGWMGKSIIAHLRMGRVDAVTNSKVEGFRVEGIDQAPISLLSMDPSAGISTFGKRARRLQMQRFKARQFLEFFVDFRKSKNLLTNSMIKNSNDDVLSPAFYSFIILSQICSKLMKLVISLRNCKIPQKWLSSSLGISVEIGDDKVPISINVDGSFSSSEIVGIHIFDWGRSELNTQSKYQCMSDSDKLDREDYWDKYVRSVSTLCFESCNLFWHKYANKFNFVQIEIWDYDALTPDDFIGYISIPLRATEGEVSFVLKTTHGDPVLGLTGKPSQIFVEIQEIEQKIKNINFHEKLENPMKMTAEKIWQVKVIKASDLPKMDFFSTADPSALVRITELSELDSSKPGQRSRVIPDSLFPEWDESFIFLQGIRGELNDLTSALLEIDQFPECFEKLQEIGSKPVVQFDQQL